MELNIVLCEPEIPPNTGNVSRTCAAIGARLHLIHPLGFALNEATVRRAGLDYWQHLDLSEYSSIGEFFEQAAPPETVWYLSTKAERSYTSVAFESPCWLMFGKETKGLPESLIGAHPERCLRIPMLPQIRSLNLSNTAAVLAYEVMRQWGFPGLESQGNFPHNHTI
jgi:tRNA (cytidine/uridine-2'-O-)-methyltransferase